MSENKSATENPARTGRSINRSYLFVHAVAVAILATTTSSLRADEGNGRWIGIFIGVDNYGLKYASGDATRQSQIFANQFGYDTTVFSTDATDDSAKQTWQPTLGNLQKQIPQILTNANREDTVIVSFSGHGVLDDEQAGYLLAQDADLKNVYETSLPLAWLREQLRACQAKTKFILLDCCHAGTDKGVAIEPVQALDNTSGQELGNSLKGVPGLLTLASCRAHQKSYELPRKEQGLFTYYLIEGLTRGADDDDDRKITATEIYQYVRREVMNYAEDNLDADQVPVLVVDKAGVLNDAPIAKWSDPKLREVIELRGHEPKDRNRGGGPAAVTVSSDGKIAAAISHYRAWGEDHASDTPVVWDLHTGKLIGKMSGLAPDGASAFALNANGGRLAGHGAFSKRGSAPNYLCVWEVANPSSVRELIYLNRRGAARSNVRGVVFSGADDKLASVHAGGEVFVWDIGTGQKLQEYQGGQSHPQFSSDDRLLAVAVPELEINVWDLRREGLPAGYKFPMNVQREIRKSGRTYKAGVRALRFSSDDKQIAAIGGLLGQPFTMCVWDRVTGELLSSKQIGTQPTATAFIPGKQQVLVGELNGTLGLWNLSNGMKLTEAPAHKTQIAGIAVSGNGETIVTGGADGRVLLFKLTQ